MATIGDPYDALVQLAQPSNVDTVVVDGRILRRKGQFTGSTTKRSRATPWTRWRVSSSRQMDLTAAPPTGACQNPCDDRVAPPWGA